MDYLNEKLDRLFASYRDACPDPEPGADFMPGLWRRIEARRSGSLGSINMVRRLAQVVVTATAVVTLLLAAVAIPQLERSTVYAATYLDVLADQNADRDAYSAVLAGDETR